jgi:transcriptional/translational regulatory protein YebC/TACO1
MLTGLEKNTKSINEAKLVYNPTQTVTLNDTDKETYQALYNVIEELDDVTEIFDNVA